MSTIRMKVAVAATVVVAAFAGGFAAPAPASTTSPNTIEHRCSRGYVHAVLSWGHKCLRAGQFCKVGNREYLRYGFYCPPSGHLRRR